VKPEGVEMSPLDVKLQDAYRATYPLCRVVERKAALLHSSSSGATPADDTTHDPSNVISSIIFYGSCIAVSPVVVITTAHHYNPKDMVENFGVAAGLHHRQLAAQPVEGGVTERDQRGTRGKREREVEQRAVGLVAAAQGHNRDAPLLLSRAAYLQSSNTFDVLILWLDRPLPYWVPLRARFPVSPAPLITAWYHSSFAEHPLLTTSGVVKASSESHCSAQGCVTDMGSSGAPVLCAYSGELIGMHLGSNVCKDGVRQTEFVPARTLVDLMISAGVETRLPFYRTTS
jgi:hypothetical protein